MLPGTPAHVQLPLLYNLTRKIHLIYLPSTSHPPLSDIPFPYANHLSMRPLGFLLLNAFL
jgi:hypothetical protein